MSNTPRRGRGDQGLAIVMTGLLLLPLMAFAAFGVDLASWYSRISHLQKSADAASLAGTVWMPDLGKSTTVACENLARNGVVGNADSEDCSGGGEFEITIEQGSTITSLRVIVTDPDAKRYFSGVIGGTQRLSRTAEAEYNLPIPLGSPLNYFGGDSTRTAAAPVTTYSVTWPSYYTTRPPVNRPCNIGTSSSQGLGRWTNSSFTTGHSGSGTPQCRWGSSGTESNGTTFVPPPDYTTRPANNPTCRVRQGGTTNGTVLGRWRTNPTRFDTTTSGSSARCEWNNYTTTASTIIPEATTRPPTNRPCRIGYETSGAGGGWWSTGGVYSPTTPAPPTGPAGGYDTVGNRLCEWGPEIGSTTTTPPNPIDSTRSPGFWAQIEGPATISTNGDAYSTRCYTTASCSSVQNLQYKDPSTNPDAGYWYVVQVPDVAVGSIDINVFDASHNAGGSLEVLAGDRSFSGSSTFATDFQVYRQTNPLDFSERQAVFTSTTPDEVDGSCNWRVNGASSTAFTGGWRRLCTITAPSPGSTYLINVKTPGTSGNGVNGYALEAVSGGSHALPNQPALYAYASMGMYNNNTCSGTGCTPPPATFYLAEVGPQYAGRILVLDLWDPGDVTAGDASMYPKMPSTSVPKPVTDVPTSICSYTSSPAPNPVQSGTDPTGATYASPQSSDYPSRCGIRTATDGVRRFNGTWLTIRISIPAEYTCTLGVNPETTAGSCWWGIEYNFTRSSQDVTTWQARIEGNPVRLTR